MTTIGRLEIVPLRELWRHEALDFTRWLAANLDLLADKIGGDLSFVEREVAAGAFSADIVAEDGAMWLSSRISWNGRITTIWGN